MTTFLRGLFYFAAALAGTLTAWYDCGARPDRLWWCFALAAGGAAFFLSLRAWVRGVAREAVR